jgi:hypothetical protein
MLKNPKSEIRNPKQIPMKKKENSKPNAAMFWSFEFRILDLFRISDLGFGIWD